MNEIQIPDSIWPIIKVSLTLIIGLILKDIITSFVSGFLFYINPAFKEGDLVYIDGEKAIILKIGLRETVFGILNGNQKVERWRYVNNERIKFLNLQKILVKNIGGEPK